MAKDVAYRGKCQAPRLVAEVKLSAPPVQGERPRHLVSGLLLNLIFFYQSLEMIPVDHFAVHRQPWYPETRISSSMFTIEPLLTGSPRLKVATYTQNVPAMTPGGTTSLATPAESQSSRLSRSSPHNFRGNSLGQPLADGRMNIRCHRRQCH